MKAPVGIINKCFKVKIKEGGLWSENMFKGKYQLIYNTKFVKYEENNLTYDNCFGWKNNMSIRLYLYP